MGVAVIDDQTCEERLWKMKHSGETNFYLCEINRDMVIDATYKGNKSRYINHSCSPNTEMQKWFLAETCFYLVSLNHICSSLIQFLSRRIDGETRIGIFASRDIKKGEHLTYDYQYVKAHVLSSFSDLAYSSSIFFTANTPWWVKFSRLKEEFRCCSCLFINWRSAGISANNNSSSDNKYKNHWWQQPRVLTMKDISKFWLWQFEVFYFLPFTAVLGK